MITISAAQAGQRIDNFLITLLKGVPKTRIYRALRKGEVRVNKGRVDATYRLKAGDQVRIPPIRSAERMVNTPSESLKTCLSQAILYENADFMVINKPAGLAVHGGSNVHIGLIEALRQIRTDIENLYLVHRLDRDTSGCLLLAKHREAMLVLQSKIHDHQITKIYQLLVHGAWPSDQQRVTAPLLKKTIGDEQMVVVDREGKSAETHFQVITRFGSSTLVRAQLITGRMHQIRVHAAFVGCPIVGDRKYGDAKKDKALGQHMSVNRLFLHAEQLSFTYPDEDSRQIKVIAPGFNTDELTKLT